MQSEDMVAARRGRRADIELRQTQCRQQLNQVVAAALALPESAAAPIKHAQIARERRHFHLGATQRPKSEVAARALLIIRLVGEVVADLIARLPAGQEACCMAAYRGTGIAPAMSAKVDAMVLYQRQVAQRPILIGLPQAARRWQCRRRAVKLFRPDQRQALRRQLHRGGQGVVSVARPTPPTQ